VSCDVKYLIKGLMLYLQVMLLYQWSSETNLIKSIFFKARSFHFLAQERCSSTGISWGFKWRCPDSNPSSPHCNYWII